MTHSKHVASTAITAERIAAQLDAESAAPTGVARYALALGDDALILAQRLGEWITNAPELEEDVALGNIGLDILGHARSLLTYAGSAWGKSEDDLAYFRAEHEFTNRQIFELPRGDFAATIARQLIVSLYFRALYERLSGSADETLAAIAAKALKEVDYHLDHSVQWLRRLGLGTEESHRRMQRGLEVTWPFVDELFGADAAAEAAGEAAVRPETLRAGFDQAVAPLIRAAGLELPAVPGLRGGGREGVHTEHLGHLLAEMQVLARSHPGAVW